MNSSQCKITKNNICIVRKSEGGESNLRCGLESLNQIDFSHKSMSVTDIQKLTLPAGTSDLLFLSISMQTILLGVGLFTELVLQITQRFKQVLHLDQVGHPHRHRNSVTAELFSERRQTSRSNLCTVVTVTLSAIGQEYTCASTPAMETVSELLPYSRCPCCGQRLLPHPRPNPVCPLVFFMPGIQGWIMVLCFVQVTHLQSHFVSVLPVDRESSSFRQMRQKVEVKMICGDRTLLCSEAGLLIRIACSVELFIWTSHVHKV